jgi:hypothetical protein
MSFLTWLRNGKPLRACVGSRGRAGFRPRLEVLEDRWVPSTLKVTSFSDNPLVKGSLRYEIAHASSSGKDTIIFDPSLRGATINLYSQLNVNSGVTIKGPGASLLTLTTNYNFGDPWGQSRRVFYVNSSRPVVISGLTITDNGVNDAGAGILNYSTLTVSGCSITNSEAGYGGAIANYGTMIVSGCTLSGDDAGYGGGIYNAGTMTVSGSVLANDRQWDLGSGSGIYNVGAMTVTSTTFVWDDIFGSYTDGGGDIFSNARPEIGSLTATQAGGYVTLTATNITDANPNSTIAQVMFYGFSSDTYGTLGVMGYFAQTSPGVWTYTFSTAGWTPGTYTFFAVALDSYGVFGSTASSNTVQIV